MESPKKIFTLTELGKSLRSVIERTYSSTYWIKGEIAKLNFYPRSGHCYPELVEKSGNVIQAQMRATIWAADYKNINQQFEEVAGQQLKEGMSILFRASVGYHPVYGLSLQIWEVEPAYTLGEMALEKTRNIEKLKKEQLFDLNRSLPMPLLAKRIAVISVETSKGYGDFLNILHQKASGYGWWHHLFPSVLQGDKAVEGMLSQLRVIKKVKHHFDVVAIIRGGGGDIGLNCYDDFSLAREIATFPLPVITGIGHATNETIAEMVAWSNKITPTDVAYFIIDKFRQFELRVEEASRTITSKTLTIISRNNQNIDYLSNSLKNYPVHLLAGKKARLGSIAGTVHTRSKAVYQNEKDRLNELAVKLSVQTPKTLFHEKCKADAAEALLVMGTGKFLALQTGKLDQWTTKSRLLDPENVLKRGYSITTFNGKSISAADELKPGDTITTTLYKGSVKSRVVDE